jgi:hypothetical protein
LVAPDSLHTIEVWQLDISPIWHVELSGIPMIHQKNAEGRWLPEWHPWAGETVELHISRPDAVVGQVTTIDRSELHFNFGTRTVDSQLLLSLRSSRGGQHRISLPVDAQVQSVKLNQQSIPLRQEGQKIVLPMTPDHQQAEIVFRQPIGMETYTQTTALDLGLDSVNHHLYVQVPQDRWILAVGGQGMGAVVFFWGILAATIIFALILSKVDITPLKIWHWLLLLLVLTQVSPIDALCVVAWFFALGIRTKLNPEQYAAWKFNLIQIGLVILSMCAMVAFLAAIQEGLLGQPKMYVAGNGSYGNQLHWYQDRLGSQLPQAWIVSVPLYYYRILMLIWALWLATLMMKWLPWAWQCFSQHTLWKSRTVSPS